MFYRALITAVCVLIAAPALAYDSKCVNPYAPTLPNGATATLAQIKAAHNDVMNFITKSDAYQDCLNLDIQNQKAEAAKNKNDFDTRIADANTAKAAANQREKERIGAEYNAAAHAYNEAHKAKPQ